MAEYIFSRSLSAYLTLIENRLHRGLGAALLLKGPPGGGKTSFAKALAEKLGGQFYYYRGSPDKERNLFYEIDVEGVLKREQAWVPGSAWEAFAATKRGEPAVLLIDEVDKTNPGFDAFLLRLLEEWTFRSPQGEEITADPRKLVVVLTSNGRRELATEVLRRCQRVQVPLPEHGRLRTIVRQIAGINVRDEALDLLIRIGEKVRLAQPENGPSPKELALCLVDLFALKDAGISDSEIWRDVVASYLVKDGGPSAIDKACGFKWVKALKGELR